MVVHRADSRADTNVKLPHKPVDPSKPSSISKGYSGRSVISSAGSNSTKVIKVKAEPLPKMDPKHDETLDSICGQVTEINQANWLKKSIRLVQIATGQSEFHGQFVTLRQKVHFLTGLANLRGNEVRWKLVVSFYDKSILGTYPLRGALVERFVEYHKEWQGKMTKGQMLTFCKEVGINCGKERAVVIRALQDGGTESLTTVISKLIAIK